MRRPIFFGWILSPPERIYFDSLLSFISLFFIFAEEKRLSAVVSAIGISFVREVIELRERERSMQTFKQSDNHDLD